MIKKIALCFSALLLSSCAIEEIPRQPLLTTPLGLKVKTAPSSVAGGGTALGLFFTANNPEIYFTGYAIYISTRLEDFGSFANPDEVFFPLKPTDVPGNEAQLLKNYSNPNDTNLTIFVGGAMSFPERNFYPPVKTGDLSIDGDSPPADPTFIFSSFNSLPGNPDNPLAPVGPFVSGTTYYFAVYAYSIVDAAYSLPSNIATIIFP